MGIILAIIIPSLIIFLVFIMPGFFQAPNEPPTHIYSRYINSSPQFDGEIDSLWLSNGTVIEPILQLAGPVAREDTNVGTKMYVMNNDTFLFLGIYLPNKLYMNIYGDEFFIYCDANLDGSMDLDDIKRLNLESKTYKDCWIDIQGSVGYIYQDAIQNGYITFSHSNPIFGERGDYFFEIAIPFNTTASDPSELNRTRGDSVLMGIICSIDLGNGSAYLIDWPFDWQQFQVSTFGNITLG